MFIIAAWTLFFYLVVVVIHNGIEKLVKTQIEIQKKLFKN